MLEVDGVVLDGVVGLAAGRPDLQEEGQLDGDGALGQVVAAEAPSGRGRVGRGTYMKIKSLGDAKL